MSADDDIGYGKPPRAHQFKPGQSGNPQGRRKGSKNVSALLKAALDEKVTVTINGKRKTVSKLEAAFIQQANKAAAGDLKATKLVFDMMGRSEALDGGTGQEPSPEARRKQHAQVLAALLAQRPKHGGGDGV